MLDDGSDMSLPPEHLDRLESPANSARPSGTLTIDRTGVDRPSAQHRLHPSMRVRIRNLTSQPQLNGRQGILLEFDAAKGCWGVILDDGSDMSLPPQNLLSIEVEQRVLPGSAGARRSVAV
eukprot:gnl/TRDRNA2_/TRDRNA2_174480_c4_seq3.p1 gnl/TRDRNA2_/TRDRNA2_174480_c4~~gnl/TRDRNA2_/TRDRNA2_174480_c4_seq3.p1  ORF type:complete len:130 (+),score=19.94 gnl/TRDRNA2_/TRDRNA2_174480_c4_seq3:29-391(+)